MELNEENRKEFRKKHLSQKKNHQKFFDEETKFINRANKVKKYRLQALEEEELEEEWEEYL